MTEIGPVYYANGHTELADPLPCPQRLALGGYPALLADHCELVDKAAELEARIARIEKLLDEARQ